MQWNCLLALLALLCSTAAGYKSGLSSYRSVSLSCAVNGQPCPVPTWEQTWELRKSTAIQPCNYSGFYDPSFAAKFGLVSFDWSNDKAQWSSVMPRVCEEKLVEACQLVKEINPATKCFVYRNTELALEFFTTQRNVMDEEHADWFLQFQDTVNSTAQEKCLQAGPCSKAKFGGYCCAAGNVYCEPQDPVTGDNQFFWNFSNPAMAKYWVDRVFAGPNGAANAAVDGCFSDDVQGFPQEHLDAAERMGLTASQVEAIQVATQKVWTVMTQKLLSMGAYNWQMFGHQDNMTPAPTNSTCVSSLRALCQSSVQKGPLAMHDDGTNTTMAAFLLVRPPYAWIGSGWEGCGMQQRWNPLYEMDVGEPLELCQEIRSGVFSRQWSKGSVELDCNAFEANLAFGKDSKRSTRRLAIT